MPLVAFAAFYFYALTIILFRMLVHSILSLIGKLKNLGGVFNVMAMPCFLFIVERRNIASTNRPCDILRHFREKHLKDRKCHMCSENILHGMHLRRHAEDVRCLVTNRNY